MKRFFLFALLCISGYASFSQQSPPDFKITPPSDYLPQTPTAASLGQYVDQKVDLSTGVPEISIPLYTINTGDFQMPITLSYHAGGHQVSSAASWVGLGWSISAGGSINRTIRSLEDKPATHPDSYIMAIKNRAGGAMLSADVPADRIVLDKISNSIVDAAPDLYSFNFPGASGKFMMLETGAHMTPSQPIKVSGSVSNPQSFTLTDEKGIQYRFWDAEEAYSKSGGTGTATRRKTAFMLSQIFTPQQRDISFFYTDTEFSQDFGVTYMMEYYQMGGGSYGTLWNNAKPVGTNTQSFGKTLETITWEGGAVEFISSARADVVGDLKLDTIKVYNRDRMVKMYVFTYGYFSPTDILAKRLKLISLTEVNLDGSGKDVVQQFVYNEGVNLPARNSFAYDHWGYFNNAGLQLPAFNSSTGMVDLSSKEPNLAYAQANILTDIIHPTKGKTSFEYELNQYFAGTYESRQMTIGCNATDPTLTRGKAVVDVQNFSLPSNAEQISITLTPKVLQNYGTVNGVELNYDNDILWWWDNDDYNVPQVLPNRQPGPYTLTCKIDDGKNYAEATGTVNYQLVSYGKNAGGLRVKKITKTSLDGSPPIVTNYSYTKSDGHSSGSLLKSLPVYLRTGIIGYEPGPSGTLMYCGGNTHNNLIIYTGMSPSDFATSPVGYTRVTVTQGTNGENGKTVSSFRISSGGMSDWSWMSGQLLREDTYNATNVLLSSLENIYEVVNDNVPAVTAVNAEQLGGHHCSEDYTKFEYPRQYEVTYNTHTQGWMRHDKTIVTTYHPEPGTAPQTSVVKTIDYNYDSYHQISKISEDAGNNQKTITQFEYPQSKSGTPYTQMVAANRVGDLVAKTTLLQNGTDAVNAKILSKTYVKYANVTVGSNNVPMIESQYALETTTPIAQLTSVPESPCAGLPCYEKQLSIQYATPTLDPVLITDKTNQKFTMIWGWQHDLLGQVVNALPTQVAYTSFEPFEPGWGSQTGWNVLIPLEGDDDLSQYPPAKTGKRCVTHQKIGTTGHPGGQYILAYAIRGTGTINANGTVSSVNESNWKYITNTVTITGSSDVVSLQPGGGVFIDDVRFYPLGATMKTFLQEPMVGVRAIADENGNTNYYYYDGLNRLLYIADDKKSVVQTFEYNLKK